MKLENLWDFSTASIVPSKIVDSKHSFLSNQIFQYYVQNEYYTHKRTV